MLHQKQKSAFSDALFFNVYGGLGPQSRLPASGFSDLEFDLIEFEKF